MFNFTFFVILSILSLSVSASYQLESILHKQSADEEKSETPLDSKYTDLLGEEELEGVNSSSGSIDDVLRLTSSATTARGPRSSGEAPQVRGLDDNKIFVMVDGSRQNFQSGHSSMVALDTENLKAVKIYKSATSISNSGSLAGGVNFVTKDAKDILKKDKTSGSEFKLQHNSANQEKMINGKAAFIEDNYSGYISLTSASAENLDLNNGEELEHSSYNDFATLVKLKFKNFDFKYEYFRREDDAPIDPSLNPPGSITSLFSDNETIKNNVSLKYENKDRFNALAYLNEYKSIKTREDDNQVETRGIETIGFKINKEIDSWNLGAETYVDKLSADVNGVEIVSYPNARGQNNVFFIEKTLELTQKFKVSPGLRHSSYLLSSNGDMPKKSGEALSKKIEMNYQTTKNLNSYISYSEGFNSPRVNEVYPAGLHSKGDDFFIKDNFFIPNENLREETSQIYEVGFIYNKPVLSGEGLMELQVNFYDNQVNDYILMERIDRSIIDEGNGTTQFINIPNVNLYGTEIDFGFMYDAYDFRISYSQIRGKNKTENLYLEDLPADHYNFQFKYFLDRHELTLGYLGHLSLKQDRVNAQTIQRTDETDSYLTHSISINKKHNDFDVNFRIDNFTNTEYRKHASHLYESERDFKLAIKYKINTI
jgi:hemoglobin/transferrin/lactoferrin receptor protein